VASHLIVRITGRRAGLGHGRRSRAAVRGQSCPSKPTNHFFNQSSLQCWPLNHRARILNIAQMGWLNTARNSVTAITFIVAVGVGSTQANAIAWRQ
jgi:hypothetical protein